MFKPANRHAKLRHMLMLAIALLAFASAFYKAIQHPEPALFQPVFKALQVGDSESEINTHFASTQQNIHSHAASLVELSDGRIRAFWFAGSREGAQDVEIISAVFDPAKNLWGAEHSIANRIDTQQGLLRYVKKLGNPVAYRAADGKLWLFYVTVSLGGWAGSSITAITSLDDGVSWTSARRLITSPFMNISTLVKGTPFSYNDGTIGLPVYHEFIGKFGELLRIGNNAEVISKQRLSSGKFSLQPVVLIKNSQQALALMRYSGASPMRMIATSTDDAGQHWGKPVKTELANPNAAISAVVLPDGRMLLVFNDTEKERNALTLAVSTDGGNSWTSVYQLEDQRGASSAPLHYVQIATELAQTTEAGITNASAYAQSAQQIKCVAQNCGFEFSYPYLIQAHNGDLHLVYTWNRSFIKHVRFTTAWLDQQVKQHNNAQLH